MSIYIMSCIPKYNRSLMKDKIINIGSFGGAIGATLEVVEKAQSLACQCL